MALTSTLFTGLSGLNVNQTKLNVVGNNIANVNTVAFKASRVLFKPQFYVTDAGGSPPSDTFGGTNPSQRGLGAQVAAIEKHFEPGTIEPTGRSTDFAIDGDGFFVIQGEEQRFTRDGSFKLNSANQLVTTGGDFLQGFGVDADFNIVPGALQNITIPLGSLTAAKATENVKLEGNLNASGAVASGASILATQLMTELGGAAAPTGATLLTNLASSDDNTTALFSVGQEFTLSGKKGGRDLADATFTVDAASTLDDLVEFFQGGMGINTSTPPASGPTPGVTLETDATDPNSVRMFVVGNTGDENALSIPASAFQSSTGSSPFTFADATNAAGFESDPTGESVHTSFVVYDSLGTPVTINLTAVFEESQDTGNLWRFYAESGDDTDTDLVIGTGTLMFDNDGRLISSTGDIVTMTRENTGAKTPLTVKLDFSSMTSLTSRDSELVMTEQDGSAFGTLNSFSVGADGTISGSFTNGLTRTLGQVAVATFNNPQGLVDRGGNTYVAGPASGVPIVAAPLTLGAGSIKAGALELSNVDLSEEFINLIIATTGFSASSRIITTSDQLIRELLNSAR